MKMFSRTRFNNTFIQFRMQPGMCFFAHQVGISVNFAYMRKFYLTYPIPTHGKDKLEDLKVLRHSPDLFNNVKIGQGQLQLIMKHILFYHILGRQPFWSSDLNNLMNTLLNSPVFSVKKMFR